MASMNACDNRMDVPDVANNPLGTHFQGIVPGTMHIAIASLMGWEWVVIMSSVWACTCL